MNVAKTSPGLLVGLPLHIICLTIFLSLVAVTWVSLGRPFPLAFWGAVSVPILHQFFVWLTWRLELRSSSTSKTIGFRGYVACFFFLFGMRFITLGFLAWLDRGSLGLSVLPQVILTTLCLSLGAYAAYSVKRYFGMIRAAGADHFDPRFRDMPLVNKGIFRFTNNGMYIYAFLLFWAIAIGFNSSAALVVAAFSHAYIWVHFFCTERPDMEYLYSSDAP